MKPVAFAINTISNTVASVMCLAATAAVGYVLHHKGAFEAAFPVVGLPFVLIGLALLVHRRVIFIEPSPDVSDTRKLDIELRRRWLFWTRTVNRFTIKADRPITIKTRFVGPVHRNTGYASVTKFYPVVLPTGDTLITCRTLIGARRVCRLIQRHADIPFTED